MHFLIAADCAKKDAVGMMPVLGMDKLLKRLVGTFNISIVVIIEGFKIKVNKKIFFNSIGINLCG